MSKINFFSLLLIFSFTSTHTKPATAHAVVSKHTLEIAPIHRAKISQVTLHFNSKVELELSKFHLVRAGDKHRAVQFSEGIKPGQVTIELPALDSGNYALQFKIFAADCHLTEDIIRFIVKTDERYCHHPGSGFRLLSNKNQTDN
jgi:methionine-rich copper-binding protein CopC